MNLDINNTWQRAVDACLAVVNLPGNHTMSMYADFAHLAESALTVRIQAGTRNGLTTFIARTATEHDIIIVPNADAIQRLKRTQSPKAPVLSVSMLGGGMQTYQRIWVDSAHFLSDKEIRTIYQATARNIEQRWFLLG